MTFLNVTIDTQRVPVFGLKALLHGGHILHSVGILNIRWEDFSALELAQKAGLTGVIWDRVFDDTPGTLVLTVWYPQVEQNIVQQRISEIEGVEDWEVQGSH